MRERRRRVDGQNLRVGAVGTQEDRVQLSRKVPVGCVFSGALYEAQVLQPGDVRAIDFKQTFAHAWIMDHRFALEARSVLRNSRSP